MDERSEAFLDEVRAQRLPEGTTAAGASEAVFCALEEELPGAFTARLEGQVPAGLRDLFRHGEERRATAAHAFGGDEFLGRVAAHLGCSPEEAEGVTRAVFAAMQHFMTSRKLRRDMPRQLPQEIVALWEDTDTQEGEPAELERRGRELERRCEAERRLQERLSTVARRQPRRS